MKILIKQTPEEENLKINHIEKNQWEKEKKWNQMKLENVFISRFQDLCEVNASYIFSNKSNLGFLNS